MDFGCERDNFIPGRFATRIAYPIANNNNLIMENKIYQIENESGLNFSVQQTNPFINEGKVKRLLPKQITFLVEGISSRNDLTKDGDLILSISKEEARKLSEQLKKMV